MSTKWISGQVISGLTFKKADFARANLKLAVVKRNFEFIEFYEDLFKDPFTIIPELQLPDEPRDVFLKRLGRLYANNKPFFGGVADDFGFFDRFIAYAQEYWGVASSEILKLLHPGRDLNDPQPWITKGLPLLFYSPGVEEYGEATGLVEYEGKQVYRRYKPKISGDVERYERILKIDLRKPPGQLIQELKFILAYEKEYLKAGKRLEPFMEQALAEEYGIEQLRRTSRLFDWNIDDSRQRKEAWGQLKIWDLRRRGEIVRQRSGPIFPIRRTFRRISYMLKLTQDVVKKRFYKAYELTQGREYNIERNRELWRTYRRELENECETCSIGEKCADPCPDVLRFMNQDHVGRPYADVLSPDIMELIIDPKTEKKEGEEEVDVEDDYRPKFGLEDDDPEEYKDFLLNNNRYNLY